MTKGSKQKRKRLRLVSWDYSNPGAYFVTICAYRKANYFKDEEVQEMVRGMWHRLEDKFDSLQIDESVIMQNHFHGILWICSSDIRLAKCDVHVNSDELPAAQGFGPTLGQIIGWFKTMTTNAYIRAVANQGWRRFDGHLWQRGYYDRIIRNTEELATFREYIRSNPEILPGD